MTHCKHGTFLNHDECLGEGDGCEESDNYTRDRGEKPLLEQVHNICPGHAIQRNTDFCVSCKVEAQRDDLKNRIRNLAFVAPELLPLHVKLLIERIQD